MIYLCRQRILEKKHSLLYGPGKLSLFYRVLLSNLQLSGWITVKTGSASALAMASIAGINQVLYSIASIAGPALGAVCCELLKMDVIVLIDVAGAVWHVLPLPL